MNRRHWVGLLLIGFAGTLVACGGDKGEESPARTTGLLKPRMAFPSVELLTLDGDPVDSASLVASSDAIVFFVSLGCQSCEELISVWRPLLHQIPEDVHIFAVADEEPVFARRFVETNDFPFPLYCDEKGVFFTDYEVKGYPTVVGVTAGGSIAYVGRAVTPVFTPEKALQLLKDVKTSREEN